MRGTGLITLLGLAVLTAPAHAQDARQVSVGNFAFSPAEVEIFEGETVTWTFTGPDTDHSVSSQATSEERGSFDSDRGTSNPSHAVGERFSHTFELDGEFPYFCKVHPAMTGRVIVRNRLNNSVPPPADVSPPRIGTPRVSLRKRRATFRLNEPAAVSAKLRGRTRKGWRFQGRAGRNTLKLPKRLRPGRYALVIVATDAANNRAKHTRKFSVRR